MARQNPEDHASKQASLKEKQLSEMRRMRKDADDHHQAMLNRIGFLKSEEAKLDRDIEAAKRRALELLSRKSEKLKDDDVAATAKDILEAVGPGLSAAKALRPTTGRSSLRSGLASGGSLPSSSSMPAGPLCTLPPTASTPRMRSVSAQRSGRTAPSGQPLKPTKPSPSSPAIPPPKRPSSEPSTSGTSGSARPPTSNGMPPRPDAPVGMPPRPVSNETARRKSPRKVSSPPPASSGSPSGHVAAGPSPVSGDASKGGSAMQQLDPGSSGTDAVLPCSRQQQQAGFNRMDTLGAGAGAGEDVDAELIEELIAGSVAAEHQQQQLQGLQQFNSESATRVVHVKTARQRQQDGASTSGSAAVMAAGVGWGLLPPAGAGAAAASGTVVAAEGAEKARLQQELVKKRQLRGVRKAFGLQPTMLQDSSAQVVECGAGSWQ